MRTQNLLFIFLFVFLLASCGDIKTSSYFKPPSTKLGNYKALEILDFESTNENFPKDGLSKIPEIIANKLNSGKSKFKSIVHGTENNYSADKTIVLVGEVSEYKSASDFNYEGGKLKFGEVAINIPIALLEKSTGNEITSGEVNTFSSLGFGSENKLYNEVANEIVKFIYENY